MACVPKSYYSDDTVNYKLIKFARTPAFSRGCHNKVREERSVRAQTLG